MVENIAGCTGCSVCKYVCPNKCISISLDEEGFYKPKIDHIKCIKCGICLKKCPVNESDIQSSNILNIYAAYARERTVRECSSSGGVFTILGQEALARKGFVCGAAFDSDFFVKHIVIDKTQDLEHLRKSKYVQSDISNAIPCIKKYVQDEKFVLVVGTPCQLAGIKRLVDTRKENIILVEVMCAGVPSVRVYREYIQWQERCNGGKIVSVDFRNKTKGWNLYSMSIKFDNGKNYRQSKFDDPYLAGFQRELFNGRQCYECKYRGYNRQGDITIGDFWGVSGSNTIKNVKEGVSSIIINTEKGQQYFDTISNELVYETRTKEEVFSNWSLSRPHPMPDERDMFLNELFKFGFQGVISNYLKPVKKEESILKKLRRVIRHRV